MAVEPLTPSTEFDSFADLEYGDRLRYVGPDDLEGDWAAPLKRDQPYEFQYVTLHGTVACLTRFRAPKRLLSAHPANNADHWEVVE